MFSTLLLLRIIFNTKTRNNHQFPHVRNFNEILEYYSVFEQIWITSFIIFDNAQKFTLISYSLLYSVPTNSATLTLKKWLNISLHISRTKYGFARDKKKEKMRKFPEARIGLWNTVSKLCNFIWIFPPSPILITLQTLSLTHLASFLVAKKSSRFICVKTNQVIKGGEGRSLHVSAAPWC